MSKFPSPLMKIWEQLPNVHPNYHRRRVQFRLRNLLLIGLRMTLLMSSQQKQYHLEYQPGSTFWRDEIFDQLVTITSLPSRFHLCERDDLRENIHLHVSKKSIFLHIFSIWYVKNVFSKFKTWIRRNIEDIFFLN